MGRIFQRIRDWLRSYLLAKLFDFIQQHWWWSMLTAIATFLVWIDWTLVGIIVWIIISAAAGVCEWRKRFQMVRDANERAERYKWDMDRTWLQSRSFELDPAKRKKVVVRFIVPLEQEAKAVADVLKNNGWGVDDPIPFYPEKPEVSPEHTVKVEFPWLIRLSEGGRYEATLARLTGHKVYVVDDDVSDTEPKLEQGVAMRVTVYGPKPA